MERQRLNGEVFEGVRRRTRVCCWKSSSLWLPRCYKSTQGSFQKEGWQAEVLGLQAVWCITSRLKLASLGSWKVPSSLGNQSLSVLQHAICYHFRDDYDLLLVMIHPPEMAGIRQWNPQSSIPLNTPGKCWNFPSENTGSHFFEQETCSSVRLKIWTRQDPNGLSWFIVTLPIKIASLGV